MILRRFFYYQFSNIDWYAESYDGMFFLIIMLFNVFCKSIFLYMYYSI